MGRSSASGEEGWEEALPGTLEMRRGMLSLQPYSPGLLSKILNPTTATPPASLGPEIPS